MISDAASLTDVQACSRRFLLNHEWRPVRWHPKYLHDACLREAILQLSKGKDLEKVRANARAKFLQTAANPGLDISGPDVYTIAKEWATLLESLITASRRMNLPDGMRMPPPVTLGPHHWQLSSFVDPSATLHRFITASGWEARDLLREQHSWWAAGDQAVTAMPMQLHIFLIGSVRKGERQSLWVRGWKHPAINTLRVRFKHHDGRSFKGWKPLRLITIPNPDIDDWVDQLWKEGAGTELVRQVTIGRPTEQQRKAVMEDMITELNRMNEMVIDSKMMTWSAYPMSRGQCDGTTPCPFAKYVCYNEKLTSIENTQSFVSRVQERRQMVASSA